MLFSPRKKWSPTPPLPIKGLINFVYDYAKDADFTKPRDEWGVAEWRAYAVHLEKEGTLLADRYEEAEAEIYHLKSKLSRSGRDRRIVGLFQVDYQARRNVGRPKKHHNTEDFPEFIDLIKAQNGFKQDKEAIIYYLTEFRQMAKWRAKREYPALSILLSKERKKKRI